MSVELDSDKHTCEENLYPDVIKVEKDTSKNKCAYQESDWVMVNIEDNTAYLIFFCPFCQMDLHNLHK